MPEYLAPGVFVEEVSFRQKTIEGVSTSTTGFVGPTRFGPTAGEPPLLTSFADFERIYGGLDPIRPGGTERANFLAHAVRAYFDEGGRRLYVSRVYNPPDPGSPAEDHPGGRSIWPETQISPDPGFSLMARHPGRAGDMQVRLIFRMGQNARQEDGRLTGVRPLDTVLARPAGAPTSPPGSDAQFYWADRYFDETLRRETFRLRQDSAGSTPVAGSWTTLDDVTDVRVVTVSVLMLMPGRFADEIPLEGLSFHPGHSAAIGDALAADPERRSTELFTPLVLETDLDNGARLAEALALQVNAAGRPVIEALQNAFDDTSTRPTDNDLTATLRLADGSDGQQLVANDYAGSERDPKSGFAVFEDLEDISIVAAPAAAAADRPTSRAVMGHLIGHCERMRYRVAVLDSNEGMTPGEVRELRGTIDSSHAALYYPWVVVDDPLALGEPAELALPPSGFVSGIYARSDNQRGVHKAPANEVVRSALSFEFLINTRQQEALNPEGINCLRFFEGRGWRVWGARTVSSDPEWKYLNVRRYFAYLQRSIDRGTQWTVFEPNGKRLWANLQRTVEDFLYNEFVSGRLAGRTPQQAFFVRCDESTMTQNDRDNGRLICLIGVAPLRPAEFVIFRIGQKTADARS